MTQDVLLRKENDDLKSLIGKSFNQKSKFEADKILNEIHTKAETRMIGKKALCFIVDKNEIKGVGGSTLIKDKNGKIISNLIVDNFGEILNALHAGQPAPFALVVNVVDTSGNARQLRFYLTSNWQDPPRTDGINTQIGSGTTPPTRSDFNRETPFGTAPENGFITMTNLPIWNSALGQIVTAGSIIAGGSGTINEIVLTSLINDLSNIQRRILYYRDIISPAQSFIAGQNIFVQYTIQL